MLIHGLDFRVNWRNFVVGSSFFIPALDPDAVIPLVKRTTKRLGYKIKTQTVIDRGILGLRVWRIK